MASTNPFQHVDADAIEGINESIAERSPVERYRAQRDGSRRGRRARQRKQAARAAMHHGIPEWEGLAPVILFLLFPAMLAVAVVLTGPWDAWLLYGVAALMGLYVFASAFKGIELVLACFILYLPFSTTYVIPVAPGVNGTNMLILLGLFASVMRMVDERQFWLNWPRGTTTVFIFACLSALSGITILREPGGWSYLMYNELLNYKAWLDQFMMYFIALSCIRSIDVAKRVVVYMCLGTIILVIYSVPEMLDKMGNSSIDKSRIGGPHRQPNMFGGFVAYTMLPLVAIFVTYIKDIRAWVLTPYFLIAAKVLISTFSRGAYLAMAVGAFMAAYFKGKGFLIFWATVGLCLLLLFPSLFPQAIKDRLFGSEEPTTELIHSQGEKLDKSSEHRIILWRAGGKMILESPILGKGFKGFKKLKAQYTEKDIFESDPHNTYLYIATQMGLPAMVLFCLILGYSFHLGRKLSRNKEDLFIRAIGIGGASATVCYSVICIFGSRAINLEFTSYFWAYFVCMQVIDQMLKKKALADQPKRKRTNAFENRTVEQSSQPKANDVAEELSGQRMKKLPAPELAPATPSVSAKSRTTSDRKIKRKRSDLAEARERRRRLKPRN